MSESVNYKNIFLTFLKAGTILLGGGYIILPILQDELVSKRNWITSEELTDYYAISQSLPGLIAINISILVGYKLKGKTGAIAAVLGITFSAFWAIVILASVLTKLTMNPYIQSAFWGIGVAVVVLIISAVREMWDKAIKDFNSFILYLIVLFVMLFTKISPAYLIISSVFLGIVYKSIERHFNNKGGI